MLRTEFRAALCNDPYEIRLMRNLYDSAVKQLSLKFEILNNEFKVLYARNPIHHISATPKPPMRSFCSPSGSTKPSPAGSSKAT